MALDDILAAITKETDQRIATAKEAYRIQLSDMRKESDLNLLAKKQKFSNECNEKEQQMRSNMRTHFALHRRNAMLLKKHALLEQFYTNVAEAIAKERPAIVEKFLTACLDQIKEKGELHPAKNHAALLEKIADKKQFTIGKPIDALGGFIFTSETQERNCTIEYLVKEQLRPATEVDVASSLFA